MKRIELPNEFWQDHTDWQAREAQAAHDKQRRHPREYPPTLQERLRAEFTVDDPPRTEPDNDENEVA